MVFTGDVMKSMQLLMYKAEEQKMEVRARDFHSNWMTAVDVLDDDKYIGAENSYNLFTVRKNSDAAADEERGRLEVCRQYMHDFQHVPCHADQHATIRCPWHQQYQYIAMGTDVVVGLLGWS